MNEKNGSMMSLNLCDPASAIPSGTPTNVEARIPGTMRKKVIAKWLRKLASPSNLNSELNVLNMSGKSSLLKSNAADRAAHMASQNNRGIMRRIVLR